MVNIIQHIKFVWKRRINIIFHKDQTNPQKQIMLKVDAGNNSYFCKKLSGADLNWSKQIRNPWRKYEMSIFSKVWGLQLATLLPAQLLYSYCSRVFCTSFLRSTYSGKHFLVAVPFYVNCETRKLSRKPLKNKTNLQKVKFTVFLQIIY